MFIDGIVDHKLPEPRKPRGTQKLRPIESEPVEMTGCDLFKCYRVRGNLCCAFCKHVGKCNNRCLNDPEKCKKIAPLRHMNKSLKAVKHDSE